MKALAEGQKKIRYECRKQLADTRPRVKGRFARAGSSENLASLLSPTSSNASLLLDGATTTATRSASMSLDHSAQHQQHHAVTMGSLDGSVRNNGTFASLMQAQRIDEDGAYSCPQGDGSVRGGGAGAAALLARAGSGLSAAAADNGSHHGGAAFAAAAAAAAAVRAGSGGPYLDAAGGDASGNGAMAAMLSSLMAAAAASGGGGNGGVATGDRTMRGARHHTSMRRVASLNAVPASSQPLGPAGSSAHALGGGGGGSMDGGGAPLASPRGAGGTGNRLSGTRRTAAVAAAPGAPLFATGSSSLPQQPDLLGMQQVRAGSAFATLQQQQQAGGEGGGGAHRRSLSIGGGGGGGGGQRRSGGGAPPPAVPMPSSSAAAAHPYGHSASAPHALQHNAGASLAAAAGPPPNGTTAHHNAGGGHTPVGSSAQSAGSPCLGSTCMTPPQPPAPADDDLPVLGAELDAAIAAACENECMTVTDQELAALGFGVLVQQPPAKVRRPAAPRPPPSSLLFLSTVLRRTLTRALRDDVRDAKDALPSAALVWCRARGFSPRGRPSP